MTAAATRAAAETAARFDAMIERIRRTVDQINRELLGVEPGDWNTPKLTVGYIGNLDRGRDDRMWSVYLPHPGRVGTDEDRIGFFPTGDEAGAQATLNALAGFRKGLRFANGPAMAEIRWQRAARIATD